MAANGPNDPDSPRPSGISLFLKLFVLLAVLVGVVATGVFYFGSSLWKRPDGAARLLEELKSGGRHGRWQAAFELARLINQGQENQFNQELRAGLVKALEDSANDDPRVREYLALVLGTLKEKSAVEALAQAALDGNDDVKTYSLWALGNIADEAGGPAALQALSDRDEGVRRMAVGALSAMRYEPARTALRKNLRDASRAIRYDSAVALARLKDEKAVPTLLEMLSLKAASKPSDSIIRSAKLAAIDGTMEMPDARLKAEVEKLSRDEPDVVVRGAAIQAISSSKF
jgi:HEAT repeat protein